MLDFKELEAFVWAVRLGSFRKAAVRLHLTQPSISERISRLEATVGETLLERSARPILPTMRGREFFLHAEKMLHQRDEALSLFDNDEVYSAPLRIGTIETIAHSWFTGFVRNLTEKYPRLTIELTVDFSPALNQRLLNNDLDIILAMDGYLPGSSIEQLALNPFEMGMFVSPRHADFLQENPYDWISKLPFISFGKEARPYAELVGYLAEQGVTTPRIHSVNTLHSIVRMSTEGLGVGALPVATVLGPLRSGELLRVDLASPLPAMYYHVLWRRANHARFCRDVATLAQACSQRYARARNQEMAEPIFNDTWVALSTHATA